MSVWSIETRARRLKAYFNEETSADQEDEEIAK